MLSQKVAQLEDGFHRLSPGRLALHIRYKEADEIAQSIEHTKEDIEAFVKEISALEDDQGSNIRLALYLSALINTCEGADVELNLHHLRPLHCLGYNLKDKRLAVRGDVGLFLAREAEGCEINIYGNAGSYAGIYARNCRLIIEGDAGDALGYFSEGCDIRARNAGHDLGSWAERVRIEVQSAGANVGFQTWRSRIYVREHFLSISDFVREETYIYQKGRLIYPPKAERLWRWVKRKVRRI